MGEISKNIDSKKFNSKKKSYFSSQNPTTDEVTSNILGKLLSYSMKTETKIDFKKVFEISSITCTVRFMPRRWDKKKLQED